MIAIPLLCMFIFDMVTLYGFYMIETSKIQMMFGVMLGTILKIILFVLYQKYLSDE